LGQNAPGDVPYPDRRTAEIRSNIHAEDATNGHAKKKAAT